MESPRPPTADPGRLMLWPGHGVYVGPLLPNTPHAHHAVQVTAALTGRISTITPDGKRRGATVAVFGADETHWLGGSATTFQLYLDPGGHLGRVVGGGEDARRRRLADRVSKQLPTLRHLWTDHAPLDAWTAAVAVIAGSDRASPDTDARVIATLAGVHARPAEPPSLAEAAAHAHLSPGRLGHLFSEHAGLPYRRYLLWVRLIAAIADMQTAASLTEVAHDVGFADQAHLTRTFRRMFGMAPSTLTAQGTSIEIDLTGWVPRADLP